ncbi:hypothetical protein PCASD_07531 [Puccinia coronata f. sp. avenae]|uniref:Uncharacterized protein n=1 Tax=Puccinia coronata f. sp. avenae TaxID=200324 RepID=A0A2N5V0A5_9BASI|nr:hypothetical protein PCASD_07531 [Puccinia coronata f. sp. avenae]
MRGRQLFSFDGPTSAFTAAGRDLFGPPSIKRWSPFPILSLSDPLVTPSCPPTCCGVPIKVPTAAPASLVRPLLNPILPIHILGTPLFSSLVQLPTTIRPFAYEYAFHPLHPRLDSPLFDLTAVPRIPNLDSPVFNPENRYHLDQDPLPILSANRAMLDLSWLNSPPLLAWSTDIGSLPKAPLLITVEPAPPEVKLLHKAEDLDKLTPAVPNATYPFADLTPVDLPTPFGLYNPSTYHHLANHKIHALLERNHNPALFDRYAFSNNNIPAFYESVASHFVRLCNNCPPCNDYEHHCRTEHFHFMTRWYHSFDRVVR